MISKLLRIVPVLVTLSAPCFAADAPAPDAKHEAKKDEKKDTKKDTKKVETKEVKKEEKK